jgi:opacity protein-like surface antigen
MRIPLMALAVVVLAAGPASAQSHDPFQSDFSANYDFVYHELDETSAAGAHFDLATTLTRSVPFLVMLGEAGFNHFDSATISSVMGGVRLRFPNASATVLPFAQVLLGLYHCCGVNDFAIQPGGGVDFKVSPNFRIRAQIDLRHVFDDFGDFNAVRASAGIVLPLNR